MKTRQFGRLVRFAMTSVLVTSAAFSAVGEDRVYEQDGMLYREVRVVDRTPIARVAWEERQQIVPVEQFVTVFREVPETVNVPVVDYHFQPTGQPPDVRPDGTVIPGNWIPYTRWEARTTNRRVAQSVRQVVNEPRTVRVPVRQLGFAVDEKVNRVVLGPAQTAAPQVARAPDAPAAAPPPAPPVNATVPLGPPAPGSQRY